jgi:hypothetical protein
MGPPLDRFGERGLSVVDTQADHTDALAVPLDVFGGTVIGAGGRGHQQGDVVLAQQHRLASAQTRTGATATGDGEAELVAQPEGRLLGVINEKLDVINQLDIHTPPPGVHT